MPDKRQHSRFGGSAAKRFFACPGSVALCDRAPSLPPTPESREGTAAHNLIEWCLKTGGFDPDELVGRFMGETPEDRFEITPEIAEAVTPFVDDVRADIQRGATVLIEHKFSLADFDAECWGQCDAISYFPPTSEYAPGLLRVRDYKHGAGVPVPAENNTQLLYYGLGALMALNKPVNRVELCIYQPNVDWYGDGEPARSWEVGPGELIEFGGELVAAVEAARKPDAALNPGEHCRFCKARGMCPALQDLAMKTSGADLIPYTGDVMVPEPPKSMTPDDLARVLNLERLIRIWLNGVKALALAEMHRGNVATGYKPVEMKTRRRFKDPDKVAAEAAAAFVGEVTEADMFTRRLISPAALERIVTKKRAAAFLATHAERPKRLTLAPVSDKRDAVPVGSLAEFEVIGESDNETQYP